VKEPLVKGLFAAGRTEEIRGLRGGNAGEEALMAFVLSGVTSSLQRHRLEVRGAIAFAASLADVGGVLRAVMVVASFPVGRCCRDGRRQRIIECHVLVFLWAGQEEDGPDAAFCVVANVLVGALRATAGKRTRSIPHRHGAMFDLAICQ